MEVRSDIMLRGAAWDTAFKNLSDIFKTRTNYSIYIISLAIGLIYDKRIDIPEDNGEEERSVPRNVIQNNDNGKLDYFFQAAVLSTMTEKFTEEQRLELAFGEKTEFNKIAFLTSFANFGVTKLIECIGTTNIESMENIKNFLIATVEDRNLDIDELSDDILLSEDE